ncbi:hypothetical protein GR254_13690, partial [Mycobacterium tuberculosis]|nr:hypothetical protein [Mycobacterium tuberculosis]
AHAIALFLNQVHRSRAQFANKLPGQPLVRIAGFGYNEAATEDAWRRVFEFFGQHLRAGSPGEP